MPRLRPVAVAVTASLALAACYDKPPPQRPQIELPPLQAGVQLVVENTTVRVNEPYSKYVCGHSGGGSGCWSKVDNYRDAPQAEVSYAGAPLERGQIYGLTATNWEHTKEEFDRLRTRCGRYAAPRAIAAGLAVGSFFLYSAGGNLIGSDETRLYASGAALGASALIYAAGYLLGGSVCNDANEMYEHYFANASKTQFRDRASTEINQAVNKFNRRMVEAAASAATDKSPEP